MRIILAFNDLAGDEASDLGDAFWLADSVSNRRLAEVARRSNRSDPNSAVFMPPSGDVQPRDVLALLDDIDLHHPDWREIKLSGVEWTPQLQAALRRRKLAVDRIASKVTVTR